MSFLLDTNICSAHLKLPGAVAHRMLQHSGRIFISSIVLGGLLTWAYRRSDPAPLVRQIKQELLIPGAIHPVDGLGNVVFSNFA